MYAYILIYIFVILININQVIVDEKRDFKYDLKLSKFISF